MTVSSALWKPEPCYSKRKAMKQSASKTKKQQLALNLLALLLLRVLDWIRDYLTSQLKANKLKCKVKKQRLTKLKDLAIKLALLLFVWSMWKILLLWVGVRHLRRAFRKYRQ